MKCHRYVYCGSSCTPEVYFIKNARIGADLSVAIPKMKIVIYNARGLDVFRRMALEYAAAYIDLIQHIIIIVGNP